MAKKRLKPIDDNLINAQQFVVEISSQISLEGFYKDLVMAL